MARNLVGFPEFVTSISHWESQRQKSALHRKKVSLPLRVFFERFSNEINTNANTHILDYGCGYGDDVGFAKQMGHNCCGYDPYFSPNVNLLVPGKYELISFLYCLNVIEIPQERSQVLNWLWNVMQPKYLLIAVRDRVRSIPKGYTNTDREFWTSTGTYQVLFSSKELKDLISSAIANKSNYQIKVVTTGTVLMSRICN